MFLTRKSSFAVLLCAIAAVQFSCRRDREGLADTDTSLAQQYSSIEQSSNELNNLIAEVIDKDTITSLKTEGTSSPDWYYTKTIQNDTVTVQLDFGNSNTLSLDQKLRRGRIIIHVLKNKTWASAETQDYFLNDISIQGTRTFVRSSLFEADIESSTTITFADGSTVSETASREILQTEGMYTQNDRSDDVFSMTGSATGTNASGVFAVEITSPLKIARSCANIISGSIQIVPEKKLPRSINFGNGDCDNLVTLSIGKYSKIIALK
jgi:hypothetical protein